MDKSNIDMNKLADKAWGSMSQILDKEMPQRKDRKRFFIWFFLLGALLLTASYFISQSSSKIDQNTFANNKVTSNQENSIARPKPNEAIYQEDEANLNTASVVDQIEAEESTKPRIASDLALNSVQAPVFTTFNNEDASTILENSNGADLVILTDSSSPIVNEDDPSITEESKAMALKGIIQISTLSSLDCSLLGKSRNLRPAMYADLEPFNLIEPINEKARLKYLLGLSSSWTTDGFFKGFGGTFDMQAPLSRRVFALGGISFHRYKTKDRNSPSFDLSTNESGAFEDIDLPENEEDMDENEVANVESIRNNLEFKDFNAVDLHLGVGLEIAKGFGFWMGGNLKYVFSIDQTDFEPLLSVGSVGSSLNSNSWFINPKFGLYYDIKDRLRVGLSFERGFKHVYHDTNNIVEFDPLSFTNLQVAYSF